MGISDPARLWLYPELLVRLAEASAALAKKLIAVVDTRYVIQGGFDLMPVQLAALA